MKKIKTFFAAMLMAAVACAQTRSDVFIETMPVTWLGLDFSKAKFIGDREHLGSESDVHRFMEAWNDLILTESSKYDVAAAIGRKTVQTATDVTKHANNELDVFDMFSAAERDYIHLNTAGVAGIVAGYDFKGLKGIGLMFNVESFSKLNDEGSMWITFVNMATKEVLFTERLAAPPKGFGIRNYWAGSIHSVLDKIKKKEFEVWRTKYAG